jgi:hypothetical protein
MDGKNIFIIRAEYAVSYINTLSLSSLSCGGHLSRVVFVSSDTITFPKNSPFCQTSSWRDCFGE